MRQIYLETDEEITSVVDKIRKEKETEIALIFPKKAAIAHSIISLKLLQKEALSFGKNIIFISPNSETRGLAKKAGLKTGVLDRNNQIIIDKPGEKKEKTDIKDVLQEKLEPSEETKPSFVEKVSRLREKKRIFLVPPSFFKILLPLIIILALAAGYCAIFVLPEAEIKIILKTEKFSDTQDIVIDSQAGKINLEKGIIPGKMEIKEVWIPKKKFDVRGEKEIGDKAHGEITVYNKHSSGNVTLPKETKFETQGKVFLSLSDFEIPGAKIKGGKTVPGQVKVKVEAKVGGTDYNLKPSTFVITSLSSLQQKDIWGESQEEFSGGTSKKIKALSEEDVKQAKLELAKEGARQVSEQMLNVVPKEKMFIENGIQAEIMEAKTETKIDQEAASFEMEGKVRVKVIIFDKESLAKVIFSQLEKKLKGEKFVVDKNLEKGILPEGQKFDAALGKLIIRVKINKEVARQIDTSGLKKQFFGLNKGQIQEKLSANPEIRQIEVRFWPAWVKKAPNKETKIKIFLDIENAG